MINWISSEDENNAKKIDFENLCKIINFVKKQKSDDEMVNYVCQIFEEYKKILSLTPTLLRQSLEKYYGSEFVINGNLEETDVIISPSDLNAYYTIKELNKEKKDLTIICFDLHSDTYDYNDFLWKGNSFSKLMKEGYVNHYIVIGVPKEKRNRCLLDTNQELRNRVHLIDKDDIFNVLKEINSQYAFVSIDADCFDCRKSQYTAIEYSPSTILNYVSHISSNSITNDNFIDKIHECVHVKNELGYSNYYHTGENNLSVLDVVSIINDIVSFCENNGIILGLKSNSPYFQIMEVSGYDYGNLTMKLVVKLIDCLVLKEVKLNGEGRVLKKSRKNG